MIFLSHNWKDKAVIEQFDHALVKVFGREKVFYDSWSIQPGDGVIDKMNSGLESCKYFLFFISANSLDSPMVRLEWQNALIKAAKNDIKFIPIRVDRSEVPVLLTQTVWIDLYSNGLEVSLRQVTEVCSGENIYKPSSKVFSNLRADMQVRGRIYEIEVLADYFMEPISNFMIAFGNDIADLEFSIPGEAAYRSSNPDSIKLSDNRTANIKILGLDRPTTPGHPVKLHVEAKQGVQLILVAVMHERSKGQWAAIPLTGYALTSVTG